MTALIIYLAALTVCVVVGWIFHYDTTWRLELQIANLEAEVRANAGRAGMPTEAKPLNADNLMYGIKQGADYSPRSVMRTGEGYYDANGRFVPWNLYDA